MILPNYIPNPVIALPTAGKGAHIHRVPRKDISKWAQ